MSNFPITRRTMLKAIPAAATLATVGGRSFSQSFPDRPITLVCGWGAGTIVDVAGRIIAEGMAAELGQKVLIENRSSTAGVLALTDVVNAKPDGHTLMLGLNGQFVVSPHTIPDLPANPMKDLAHICMMVQAPYFLAVNKAVGVSSIEELVALAKSKPGTINYGSPGAGSTGHLTYELVKLRTGIDITPVHYKGAVNLIPDLIANQVQLGIDVGGSYQQYVKSGVLVPLVVTSPKRSTIFPDVPSAIEAKLDGLENIGYWSSLHAPRDTPPQVIARIRDAARAALNSEAISKRLTELHLNIVDDTPEIMVARMERESATYAEAAKAAGVKI